MAIELLYSCLLAPLPSWMKVKASKRISNGNDAEGPIPWQVGVYDLRILKDYVKGVGLLYRRTL